MKIILTVTDKEVLRDYKIIHPDFIEDDFRNNTEAWLERGYITVVMGKRKGKK